MPYFSEPGTVADILERNLTLYPDAPALTFGENRYTYRQFVENAFRLANELYSCGVGRQARVAILAQNSDRYLEIYAACEISGFIAVPINYRLAASETAFIIRDSSPLLLFFDPEYADIVQSLRKEFDDLRLISLGDETMLGVTTYRDFVSGGAAVPPPIRSKSTDIAYLIYTSGTTGRPKGTLATQKAMALVCEYHAREKQLKRDERYLAVMPLYHVGAKYAQLAAIGSASELILHRQYNIEAIARDLDERKIAVVHLAPIMVQDLLNLVRERKFDHSSLRLINYASGPMSVPLLERAIETYGPIFMQHYGMTETGGGTVLHPEEHIVRGNPALVRRLASAGRPSHGTRVKIVRDNGSECDIGEQGEILLLSETNMRGYWNNHAATMAAIDEDGWLHSGDIGYFDEGGYLYVSDRKKDMIISGGENIYPREVEEALYRHPAVAEVAVIGIPDPRWGESVKAFVVLKKDAVVAAEELIEFCRTHIASYKKPKVIEFAARLPRLANHKIDKKELRKADWASMSRQVN